MKTIWTLVKLQFKARVAIQKRRSLREWFKFVLMIATLVVLFAVFVLIYALVAREFIDVRGGTYDLRAEFLIFTLFGFQVLQTIFLVPALVRKLDINNERELLMKLPVTERQIFVSKIAVAFILEVIFAAVILLPILVAYGIVSQMHWGFFLAMVPLLVFAPVIPFFLASLLVCPVTKLVNLMRARAILTSIGYLVMLVGAIYLYMMLVNNVMIAIVDSGRFQEAIRDNVDGIRAGAQALFPQFLFANMIDTNWYTALWSFFAIVGMSAALMALAWLVAGAHYKKMLQEERGTFSTISRKKRFCQRSGTHAAVKKETLNIFRSSNYTFQFMLLVIVMPMLVFFVNRVAMFSTYESFRNWGPEAVDESGAMAFGVSMFVMLIILPLVSSFAASNITREGWNVFRTKMIPQSFRRQLTIKAFVVFIPIFLSVVISVAMLRIPYQAGVFAPRIYISWNDFGYLLAVASALVIGYISFGMYLDLRNPLCAQVGSGELTRTTTPINTVMVTGLIIGAAVGLLMMLSNYTDILSLAPLWLYRLARMGENIRPIFMVFSLLFALGGILTLFLDGPRRYSAIEL